MPDRRSGSTPEQIALSVQRSAPTAVTASRTHVQKKRSGRLAKISQTPESSIQGAAL